MKNFYKFILLKVLILIILFFSGLHLAKAEKPKPVLLSNGDTITSSSGEKLTVVSRLGSGGVGTVYTVKTSGGELKAIKAIHKSQELAEAVNYKEIIKTLDPIQSKHLLKPESVSSYSKGSTYNSSARFTGVVSPHGFTLSLKDLATNFEFDSRVPSAHRAQRIQLVHKVMRQLVLALNLMIQANVLHNDIKPSNITFRWADGRSVSTQDLKMSGSKILDLFMKGKLIVAIIDFDGTEKLTSENTSSLGTRRYRAPERNITRSMKLSDHFSLGITLASLISNVEWVDQIAKRFFKQQEASSSKTAQAISDTTRPQGREPSSTQRPGEQSGSTRAIGSTAGTSGASQQGISAFRFSLMDMFRNIYLEWTKGDTLSDRKLRDASTQIYEYVLSSSELNHQERLVQLERSGFRVNRKSTVSLPAVSPSPQESSTHKSFQNRATGHEVQRALKGCSG